MGVFTCITVKVLIVDDQTGSQAGVVHPVAVRVACCFTAAAAGSVGGGGFLFLSITTTASPESS